MYIHEYACLKNYEYLDALYSVYVYNAISKQILLFLRVAYLGLTEFTRMDNKCNISLNCNSQQKCKN